VEEEKAEKEKEVVGMEGMLVNVGVKMGPDLDVAKGA